MRTLHVKQYEPEVNASEVVPAGGRRLFVACPDICVRPTKLDLVGVPREEQDLFKATLYLPHPDGETEFGWYKESPVDAKRMVTPADLVVVLVENRTDHDTRVRPVLRGVSAMVGPVPTGGSPYPPDAAFVKDGVFLEPETKAEREWFMPLAPREVQKGTRKLVIPPNAWIDVCARVYVPAELRRIRMRSDSALDVDVGMRLHNFNLDISGTGVPVEMFLGEGVEMNTMPLDSLGRLYFRLLNKASVERFVEIDLDVEPIRETGDGDPHRKGESASRS